MQSSESTSTNRPITYMVLDNLGEVVRTYSYDADGISLTDFSTAAVTAAIPTADASHARSLSVANFDDEGRDYLDQTFNIDQSSGTSGLTDAQILALPSLATNTFYDHRGNVMAVFSSGGVVDKAAYDGARRIKTEYVTDGGAVGNSDVPLLDWTDASSVSSDVVLSQADTLYDDANSAVLSVDRERFDNDSTSSTGALGTPSSGIHARVYFAGQYFDAAGRLTDSADFGTNTGTAITSVPLIGSLPSGSLETKSDYDAGGRLSITTDPRGIQTLYSYDLQGRQISVVAGHTISSTPVASIDQTTLYVYNANGDVMELDALLPGGTDEYTAYVYGVGSTIGTDLFSNDLILKVEYPTKTGGSAGQPSTSASDDISYTYNLLGENATKTDQNGNVHTYSYDVLGRLTLDAVTTLGSGVDGSIRALGYSYTALGLPYQDTSYSNAAGTTMRPAQRLSIKFKTTTTDSDKF